MLFEMHAYMDICGLILGICVFKCVYVYGGGGLVLRLLANILVLGLSVQKWA